MSKFQLTKTALLFFRHLHLLRLDATMHCTRSLYFLDRLSFILLFSRSAMKSISTLLYAPIGIVFLRYYALLDTVL